MNSVQNILFHLSLKLLDATKFIVIQIQFKAL